MFIDFCTSCGSFDVTTFTPSEEKTIQRFSDVVTNPRSQGCPRFQSGEELANSVGKINAYYSL